MSKRAHKPPTDQERRAFAEITENIRALRDHPPASIAVWLSELESLQMDVMKLWAPAQADAGALLRWKELAIDVHKKYPLRIKHPDAIAPKNEAGKYHWNEYRARRWTQHALDITKLLLEQMPRRGSRNRGGRRKDHDGAIQEYLTRHRTQASISRIEHLIANGDRASARAERKKTLTTVVVSKETGVPRKYVSESPPYRLVMNNIALPRPGRKAKQ